MQRIKGKAIWGCRSVVPPSKFAAMCRTGAETLWLQKDGTLSAHHHDFTNAGNLYLYCFIFALHATSCMLLWVALNQFAVTLLKSLWTVPQTSLDVFHVSRVFQISAWIQLRTICLFSLDVVLYFLSRMYNLETALVFVRYPVIQKEERQS